MYYYKSPDEYLEHHGVKGQKWGVRRKISRHLEKRKNKKKMAKVRQAKELNKYKKKRLKNMTDKEIQKKIERLLLEKHYRELRRDNISEGERFVKNVLKNVSQKTLENLGTQAMTHILGEAINKAGKVNSADELRRIVNPQKGQKDK